MSHCLCECLSLQTTTLPVFLFQHTDESSHPYTTAKLASLGATSITMQVGVTLDQSIFLDWLSEHDVQRPVLLYPPHNYAQTHNAQSTPSVNQRLEKSIALTNQPFDGVVVLDGTWRNTREMLLSNPFLCLLPTLSLQASYESEYVIRKSTKAGGLSTIEAIAELLSIEKSFDRDAFLKPMRTLVNQQLRFRMKNNR